MKSIFLLFNLLLTFTLVTSSAAQATDDPYVYGRVLDVFDTPLPGVEVVNTTNGNSVFSDERGFYNLTIEEEKFTVIRFEYFDHDIEDRKVFLRKGDIREINPMMRPTELLLLASGAGIPRKPKPKKMAQAKPKPKPKPNPMLMVVAPTYGVSRITKKRNPNIPIAKSLSDIRAEEFAQQRAIADARAKKAAQQAEQQRAIAEAKAKKAAAEAAQRKAIADAKAVEEAAKAAKAAAEEAAKQSAIAAAKKEREVAEMLALRKQKRLEAAQISFLKMRPFQAIPATELIFASIPVSKRSLPKIEPIVEEKRPWWQFWKKR